MGPIPYMEVIEAGPKAKFKVGDLVQGFGGWRSHVVSDGAAALWQTGTFPMVFPEYRKLDKDFYCDQLPLSTALGVMGAGHDRLGYLNQILTLKGATTF